jgi:hypothetical protein
LLLFFRDCEGANEKSSTSSVYPIAKLHVPCDIHQIRNRNMDFPMTEQARSYRGIHPIDVKAAIKKKFGTIVEFHSAYGLPATGLHDVLRGRASKRVEAAVDEVLAGQDSMKLDSSANPASQHLNAEGQ